MYWHGTIAAVGRRALFPSPELRIAAARSLARTGGEAQLLFCASDDHVHTVVRAPEGRIGQLGGNLRQALRHVADAPLEPMRWKVVESRTHLESLVPYLLDQSSHHALLTASHPATWTGSCFLDLVGARLLPGFSAAALREALPRLPRADVWRAVRLDPLEPADDVTLAGLGIHALVTAARGALGRAGRSPAAVRGRAAVARIARELGVAGPVVCAALAVPPRTRRDAAATAPDPDLDRALRLWVAIHTAATPLAATTNAA